jgi:protein-disulfide isomerase
MANNRVEPGRGPRSGVVKGAKKGQKRNRTFFLLIAVLAVGGIAALTYFSTQKPVANTSQVDPNLPEVQSNGYALGSPQAPLEVMEFGDFECPGCGRFAEIIEPDVRTNLINTGKIRFRFIDFPLPMHQNTWNASRAAACADVQGKFWEMHDVLYGNQDQWNGEVTNNPDKVIKGLAPKIPGLDTKAFDKCVDTKATQAKIQAHKKLGDERQVEGTPTFIFGTTKVFLQGGWSYDLFKAYVDSALAKQDSAKKSIVKAGSKKQ